MHYHVETNALICLIKRLAKTYLGDQSTSVATRNSATLLLESSLPSIDISLITIYILQASIQHDCIITSSANKSRIYIYTHTHIIASCWGLEFQVSSVPTHSETSLSVYALRSQPTIALGYSSC